MDLKAIRKAAGLTRKQLALASNVTMMSIYRYEKGMRKPSAEIAKRIAKVLKFDWTLFFKD
jgi:transcriptional regulator with XRE-family HTH domain